MNAKDAIQTVLNLNHQVFKMYLADLSDADLLVRPAPGANHIAWQIGHLIGSEANHFLKQVPGAVVPELPAGFQEQHTRETAAVDPPTGFLTKQQYIDLYDKVRQATLSALARMPDADLDKPNTGPLSQFAPTVGALLILAANHEMMHAGQFSVVRRKLSKPVLF